MTNQSCLDIKLYALMMENQNHVTVVTTIQKPTSPLISLTNMAKKFNEKIIVIGDKKTPNSFKLENSDYYGIERQSKLPFKSVQHTPLNSYTRKNIGYLIAASEGNNFIRETDDDNSPNLGFFNHFPQSMKVRDPGKHLTWINSYSFFTEKKIWPRGFPIQFLKDSQIPQTTNLYTAKNIGVIQGLADGAPDVDAIYRMTVENSHDFRFEINPPLLIPKDVFTPFNSQATFWNVKLLPIMYLPNTCTFRMTDIWRGYIATYLLHHCDYELIFTSPNVFQERNLHNLLKDFQDEIPGYLRNNEIVERIREIKINGGLENLGRDLIAIYRELIKERFFNSSEFDSVSAWVQDCLVIQNER